MLGRKTRPVKPGLRNQAIHLAPLLSLRRPPHSPLPLSSLAPFSSPSAGRRVLLSLTGDGADLILALAHLLHATSLSTLTLALALLRATSL